MGVQRSTDAHYHGAENKRLHFEIENILAAHGSRHLILADGP